LLKALKQLIYTLTDEKIVVARTKTSRLYLVMFTIYWPSGQDQIYQYNILFVKIYNHSCQVMHNAVRELHPDNSNTLLIYLVIFSQNSLFFWGGGLVALCSNPKK